MLVINIAMRLFCVVKTKRWSVKKSELIRWFKQRHVDLCFKCNYQPRGSNTSEVFVFQLRSACELLSWSSLELIELSIDIWLCKYSHSLRGSWYRQDCWSFARRSSFHHLAELQLTLKALRWPTSINCCELLCSWILLRNGKSMRPIIYTGPSIIATLLGNFSNWYVIIVSNVEPQTPETI